MPGGLKNLKTVMASIEDDQLSLLNPNVFQHQVEAVIKPEVGQNVVLYDDQLYHQVKEFVCDLCNKQYSRKDRLVQHKNNDEEVKKVNRFQCPFKCGKEPFRTMASLLTHCEEDHNHSLGNIIYFT